MTRSYILKGLRLEKKSSYADLNKLPLSIVKPSWSKHLKERNLKKKNGYIDLFSKHFPHVFQNKVETLGLCDIRCYVLLMTLVILTPPKVSQSVCSSQTTSNAQKSLTL